MEQRGAPAVEAVRRKISHWRKTRPKTKAMPDGLWEAAVALTPEHGVCRVARDLGLNYAALKERARRRDAALVPVRKDEETAATTAFVEVSPAQLFGGDRIGATVVLAAPDGATMTVEVPPGQPLDWAALSASFWRRGA